MDTLVNFLFDWAGWIFGLSVITAFAVRGSIKFDVNQWLKERQKNREENLRVLCPHHYFSEEDGKMIIASNFMSPPGTAAWQCQKCGRQTYSEYEINQQAKYWADNPNALLERHNKMIKLAKKLGRV